jgi:hypothetical protein
MKGGEIMAKYHVLHVQKALWDMVQSQSNQIAGASATNLAREYIRNGVYGTKTTTNSVAAPEKKKKTPDLEPWNRTHYANKPLYNKIINYLEDKYIWVGPIEGWLRGPGDAVISLWKYASLNGKNDAFWEILVHDHEVNVTIEMTDFISETVQFEQEFEADRSGSGWEKPA